MTDTLAFQDLEKVYDLVAKAIDEVGPDNESLFLGKLCLTLSHNIADLSVIENAIVIAKSDLDS
jgi:hypothetical protein